MENDLIEFITRSLINAKYNPKTRSKEYRSEDFVYASRTDGSFKYRGYEIVTKGGKTCWQSGFGGGFLVHNREEEIKVYKFLNIAHTIDNKGFQSFRGPSNLRIGTLEYTYKQKGDVNDFFGEEFIYRNKKLVFTCHIVGGIVSTGGIGD